MHTDPDFPAGFIHLPDFDWKSFDGGQGGRTVMQVEHLREALGSDKWVRSEAVKRLERVCGFGEKACQNALKQNGKFAAHLVFEDQWVGFRE
jgi:hypothetical protein